MTVAAFNQLALLRLSGAGISFLLLIILGQLLGPEGVGAFVFAMSWLGIAQLVTTLGLHHYAVRAIPPLQVASDYGGVRGLVMFSFTISLSLAVLLVAIFPILDRHLTIATDSSMQDALLFASFLLVPLTLSQMRSGVLRGFGRPVLATTPELLVHPALQVIGLTAAVLIGVEITVRGALSISLGSALLVAAISIYLLARTLAELPKEALSFKPKKWLTEGGKSSFLFAVGMLMSSTDVVMLGALAGPEQTGIYGVAARFFLLMQIPVLAASGAISHLAAEYVARSKTAELSKLSQSVAWKSLGLALVAAIPVSLLAFQVDWIFGAGFAAATTPILILVWSRVAEATMGHPASILANGGRIGLTSLVVGGGLLLNVFLNYLLVPSFGAAGAAIATSIAHLLTTISVAWIVWRAMGVLCLPTKLFRRDT